MIKQWFKKLFCLHGEWETLYADMSGWADLSYCFICKKCGKQRCK